MNLAQCAAFVAIADTGSFTHAAKALSVSQSAVSHAISGLEKDLGVALMKRSRSGVEFTDVGQRILTHARAIVLGRELIRQEADAARDRRSGTLRIGTSQSFATSLLPRLLTEFRGALPDIRIVLREGTDQEIAEWLGGYTIDVGIVNLPKEHLDTVPLLRDEMYAVLPPDHALAGRGGIAVEELADETFVMPVGGVEPMLRTALELVGREPRIGFHAQGINALLSMVAEGHGVTVVPALALPSVPPHPQLRIVPFAPALSRRLGIGIRRAARRAPAVETFVSMARALARDSASQMPRAQGEPGLRGAGRSPSGSAPGTAPGSASGPVRRISASPAMASAS
ncbi:LysR family transcriptional regulator [Streptomyces yaizuensis]|uniref:LysR family transcriptional regulator n=1 Tax=Streptomyces yaizuensis TaxID=2989713 RepID=A0ABQ5P7C5_9ACTN|nr:LysR family transcriptional regulator [Streptomyces sp. YSPA8]GLF98493.1 LysR family transcriptional regulator [Streptomyces sp. YSPA8]